MSNWYKLTFIAFIILILSGCGAYDSSMAKGKSALKSGSYQEAVTHFQNALIEKPQDKDAQLLLQQSEQQYNSEIATKQIQQYLVEVQATVNRFSILSNSDKSLERLSKDDLLSQQTELSTIKEKSQKISSDYSKNPNITVAHGLLIQSVEDYTSGIIKMVNLLPTLKKNAEFDKQHPNQPHAIPGVSDIARMNNDFKTSMQNYASYIKKIDEIKQGTVGTP